MTKRPDFFHGTIKDAFVDAVELPYARGPFNYERIPSRRSGQYRIHDRNDDAVGHAETVEAACRAVEALNARMT